MSIETLRLAYVTSHPIQYQAALFRTLAARPGVAFKAFFATDWGLEDQLDPGFARRITWDVPLLDGYDHTVVRNVAPRPRVDGFTGLVNPGIGAALAAFGADAVIVHGYAHATMWLAAVQCRARGIPVLMRGESNLLPRRSWKTRAAKAVAAAALRPLLAGALAIGQHNAAYWLHYGLAPERVFFAPYTVDNAFFTARQEAAVARAAAWRRELGLGPRTRVVGYAAKLSAVKDAATLIDAFARARLDDAALVLVGDGVLRAELEAQAARTPSARIVFAGFRNQSEMPAAYALADVFVLPSRFEPWGLAINEAMCLARPVVVSDQVGCAPDLVHADNGWVFPAGDAAALAEVLQAAFAGPDAGERLAAMGAASARRIATWGLAETAAGMIEAARIVARR